VVAAGGSGLADLSDHRVLRGRIRVGEVGQRREPCLELLLHRFQLGVELLLAVAHRAHLGNRLRGVAALALQLADPLRRLVLRRAQVLELGKQRAAAGVDLQHAV
jgi:hypothetical protein